jgi:hypothetical protein
MQKYGSSPAAFGVCRHDRSAAMAFESKLAEVAVWGKDPG